MLFYGGLSDSKSPQVCWILLSILADLTNAVVWIVSTRLVILQSFYQSFGDCIKSTNYSRYNCHFHVPQFFQFLSNIEALILFRHSSNFTLWSAGTRKSTILQVLSFFYYYDVWLCMSFRPWVFQFAIFLCCLLSHPVVHLVYPMLPLLVGRHFFCYFGLFCFVYIVWSCLGIF